MAKKKVNKGQAAEDCISAARQALNNFSETELHDYITAVRDKSRTYDNVRGSAALQRAIKDINEALRTGLLWDCGVKANDADKFDKNDKVIRKNVALSNLIGRGRVNKDHNIENSQRAAKLELRQVLNSLNDEEIKAFQAGKLDADIAAAADGKNVTDLAAKKIGQLLRDYPDLRNNRMIASNALHPDEIRDDRMLRHIHRVSKLARGGDGQARRTLGKDKVDTTAPRDIWREYIKPRLDLEKMFSKVSRVRDESGKLNREAVDEVLNITYDNILNDRSALFTKSIVANEEQALAKKRKMFFVFKDWSALKDYNGTFGEGTLFGALMKDMEASGNQIGMADIFGSSPTRMFKDLQHVQEEMRTDVSFKLIRKGVTEQLFKQVAGIDKSAWSPTMANIGASLRSYSGMARLGLNVVNSFSDIAQAASAVARFGYGFWSPLGDQLFGALSALNREDRRFVGKTMMMDLQSHMGYTGRYVDANDMGDVASKMSNAFYWLNFTTGWDKGRKLSSMTSLARGLGRSSNLEWEGLNEQTRSALERFNFNKAEWDLLRSKNDRGLFTLDNMSRATAGELRSAWNMGDKSTPFSGYRAELNRKLFGLFDTISTNSVLDPLAFEKFITTGGTRPGTGLGEAYRCLAQFKSYPTAYFRRVWMGMAEMNSTQGKIMYAANLAAGNLILGYASVTIGAWMKGLTSPDPSKMNARDQFDFYAGMLNGSFGVFNRALNAKDQTPHLLPDMFLSPSIRMASDGLATAFATATGNFKGALKTVKDLAHYANPIGTLPLMSPLFDNLLGTKPYMEPGQQPIDFKRMIS